MTASPELLSETSSARLEQAAPHRRENDGENDQTSQSPPPAANRNGERSQKDEYGDQHADLPFVRVGALRRRSSRLHSGREPARGRRGSYPCHSTQSRPLLALVALLATSLVCARVSAHKPPRPQAPYRIKAVVARFGPVYRWARRMRAVGRYAARRPHDPDFAAFRQFGGNGLFLDVGASIGQSALSFRVFNRRSPILSLEPLPSHRNDLRFVRLVARRHRFMIAGAAEESRRATLYVPTLGSYELPAESSLNRDAAAAVLERLEAEGADPTRLRLKEIEIDLRRLDGSTSVRPSSRSTSRAPSSASSRACARRSSAAIRS